MATETATIETHECAAIACSERVPLRHLMCTPHYGMLPRALREVLRRSFRYGQEHGKKRASVEWLDAADQAIAAVVEHETAA